MASNGKRFDDPEILKLCNRYGFTVANFQEQQNLAPNKNM